EYNGNTENPRGFAEYGVAVGDRLTVKVADAEEHLRLKVNDVHDAVVRRETNIPSLTLTLTLPSDGIKCLAECGRPRPQRRRHAPAGRIVRTPLALPAFLRPRTGAPRRTRHARRLRSPR